MEETPYIHINQKMSADIRQTFSIVLFKALLIIKYTSIEEYILERIYCHR